MYGSKALEINPYIMKFVGVDDYLVDTDEGIFINFDQLSIDERIEKVRKVMDMSYNFLSGTMEDSKFAKEFESQGAKMRMLEDASNINLQKGDKEKALDNLYKLLELICEFRLMIYEDERQNKR